MRLRRGQFALAVALLLLGFMVSVQLALAKKKEKQNSAAAQMDEQKRALHALSRLTFGPRPGDVERVLATGVDKWVDQQLHLKKLTTMHWKPAWRPSTHCAWTRARLSRTFPRRN